MPDSLALPTGVGEGQADGVRALDMATCQQSRPVPNSSVSIWDLVIKDMRRRDDFGRKKYGTPLQCGDGRDHLIDAYQEALDLCVYLRQEIEERKLRGIS